MGSGITPCARECKWIGYFGETPQSLDTELQQIVRDAALGTRLADKLMQVWRRDGVEQIVLVHTEIQGTRDTDFAKRIYVYNYRLFDRYDRPVVSLAVLGDASPSWRPTRYEQSLWGCRVGSEFPVVKLRDYMARWDALEARATTRLLRWSWRICKRGRHVATRRAGCSGSCA
jgi:hypothetical protein